MKNKLLLIGFTLLNIILLNTNSNAQGFRLGLTASPSIAWMNPKTDGITSEGNRTGFSYGLITEYFFTEQYGFSSGLHISYLGGKLKYAVNKNIEDASFNSLERIYRLQIIELPLALKMKSREILGINYFGKFGMGMGIILKSEGDDYYSNAQDNSQLVQTDKKINGDIAFGRLSLILGGGIEYEIGGGVTLLGGINFNNGFTNILLNNNDVTGQKNNARSNILELSLGVIF